MIELNIDLPQGYRATGEYRYVQWGEHYYNNVCKCVLLWERNEESDFAHIIIEEDYRQGEELIGCLCGVSDFSLEQAKCKSETFYQVEEIIGYSRTGSQYRTICNSTWRYAYPVSEETYKKYLAKLNK